MAAAFAAGETIEYSGLAVAHLVNDTHLMPLIDLLIYHLLFNVKGR